MELTHFSLFSGIGGADLAAEWAGFESIGQVEWADYPTKVLEKHWPDVPRWRDIRDVRADNIRPIIGDRHITVISGGFPCQPSSVAGKRKGKDDDRWLWPEMLRVVSELRPTWVIGENVGGFISLGLEGACVDLENQGYAVQAFVIPACAVGAWHERKRVFIVGHNKDAVFQNSRCKLWQGSKQLGEVSNETGKRNANIFKRPSEMVSNSKCIGQQRQRKSIYAMCTEETKGRETTRAVHGSIGDIWKSEPNVGRVANGIPSRLDRLKCLGNAIVPQQIYPIFKYIAEIEKLA